MPDELIPQILTGGAGVVATLLGVLLMLVREQLVVGSIYKRTEAKLARFEDMAVRALELAERATKKDGAA